MKRARREESKEVIFQGTVVKLRDVKLHFEAKRWRHISWDTYWSVVCQKGSSEDADKALQLEEEKIDLMLSMSEAERARAVWGWVYFLIEAPEGQATRQLSEHKKLNVKIGVSINPNARVSDLNAGNPRDLIIYHSIQVRGLSARDVEQHLHRCYQGCRRAREWFRLSQHDLAPIKELTEVSRDYVNELEDAIRFTPLSME